jgi:two-component system, LytTR family, response regulator
MTLRILIADDEPVARRRMRRLLAQARDVEIVAECGDGASTVEMISSHAPDLVFLDVQMPELDGFAVLQAIGAERMPAVVFVTAFDRYALRAFEVHALDYLLKPVDAQRLLGALERARLAVATRQGPSVDPRMLALLNHLASDRRYLARLPVRADDRLLVIDLDDVDWIGAADNYVTLHAGGREYVVRDTMGRLERELDPARFVRIHRSTIVQLDRIRELLPDFHGDFTIVLKSGARLTLSRRHRANLEKALGRSL